MKSTVIFVISIILAFCPAIAAGSRGYDIIVAQDGTGDFTTIQEAINSVPDFRKKARTTIFIKKGIYKEKLIIAPCKINLTMKGEEGTVITYDDYASKLNRFGDEKSTSGSASCYIYAPDFVAENITFENSSGPVGQAVACFVSGDRAIFRNCRFLGFQDTLYTYGVPSRQYYEDCYIEGTVDFIFGKSTAVFNRCTIHSKGNGYVTAPATEKDADYGYVFHNCKLTAAADVEIKSISHARGDRMPMPFISTVISESISHLPDGITGARNRTKRQHIMPNITARAKGQTPRHASPTPISLMTQAATTS